MKELVFLPDREGRDELGAQMGFVRVGADGSALQGLAERLVLPPAEETRTDGTLWRGVLALALLCDAWPDGDAKVSVLTVNAATSTFASWVLSARADQAEEIHLVLLEKGGKRRLLGIADAHAALILPATPTDFAGVIPDRAAWYESGLWSDPVPCLNEHERAILLARLTMMGLDCPEADALKAELTAADKAAAEAVSAEDEGALHALGLRIRAVCGLKDFEGFALREEPCCVGQDNPLVRLFSAVDVRYDAPRTSATCLWKGVPIARTSAMLGLTGTDHPGEAAALRDIESELALLEENSVRWNGLCAAGIQRWLDSQDAALLPQARNKAEALRLRHAEKCREVQSVVTLTWPWDAASGAVKRLLEEALGAAWMGGAANPFSDYLTKLTGHMLTDETLQRNCACADGVLLPPLSRELAMCAARAKDGEGLAPDMLRFEPREDGGITASFLLRGTGEVRMVRTYPVEEILVLGEAESPAVAVWPNAPIRAWHAYHIFVRGGDVTVAALSGGAWKELPPRAEDSWRCLPAEDYPACLCLLREDKCLGVLPNAQPVRAIAPAGDAQVSIDMGATATAAVIMLEGKTVPFGGESLVKTLLAPQDMGEDAFLRSLDPAELTPSVVQLTGEGDELFLDGHVVRAGSFDALAALEPGDVCTALKWRADQRSVRARRILLHQVMLGASLTAALAGAQNVSWRMTVADEMADEGRTALLNLADELSVTVAQETGLLLKDGKFMVTWAEEAAATHAYLKGPGGMKGTFAVLDMGGSSTKLHLWMQGKSRPMGGAVVLEGASTVLLDAFRDRPDTLYYDFEDCGDEKLLDAVCALCEQLTHAGESTAQADKALMMFDGLLEYFRAGVTQHLYTRFTAQKPTYMQSVLLEMYASAVFSVGLMLEQAGNDSNISHLFPEDMTVCLSGRGAWLLDTLTPQLRNGLQRIAHEPVNLRHPVRTLTIRAVPLSAMVAALGMAALKDVRNTNDTPIIRTRQSFSELMRLMMVQLFQCYPMHVWTLHPGLFDQVGSLTPAGEDTIRRTASAVYGEGEDIPGAVMAFTAALRKTNVAPEAVAFPGE